MKYLSAKIPCNCGGTDDAVAVEELARYEQWSRTHESLRHFHVSATAGFTHAGETVLDTDLPLYRSNSRILADMIINRASMNPSLIQPVKPEFEEEKNQILDVIYGDIVAKMF